MSHWTKVKTLVTDKEILKSALKNMGAPEVFEGTKQISKYGTTETAQLWIDDAVGFQQQADGTWSMIGDPYHSKIPSIKQFYGRNSEFTEKLQLNYMIEDVKSKFSELNFNIEENEDFKVGPDGLIRVTAGSQFG